jgi:hypothetical protein
MDLGGADLRVGTIGLKLPISEFTLGFDDGALLEGAGPFSELPPTTIRRRSVRVLYSPESMLSNSRWSRAKTGCGPYRWA